MSGLNVVGVRNAKPGRHADGKGLYLFVRDSGSKSWLLRVQVAGRRRDIGLGSITDLTLAEARERAAELRKAARRGLDPVSVRDADKRPTPTFREAAIACHADLKGGWSEKGAAAFLSSLEQHAFPKLGRKPVDQVEAAQLRDMLAPIWLDKPETARKVRQRASAVLNYAHSKGWRASEAAGRAVTMGLARRPTGGNFAAMPYGDVPAFVAATRAKPETVGRLALLFTILTAARSGEVRNARWSQIDRDKRLWNRPASAMKTKVAHSVTLSDAALALLDRADALRLTTDPDALVFPSSRGTPLSDMTLSKIMRDAGLSATVHGFRSSFRDFAGERMPTIPGDVAEAALAHLVPDKVERAYKRTTFLEMRAKLLQAWADHVEGRSNVLRLAAG